MITTVTTTTVSALTATSLVLIAILTLLIVLINKEIIGGSNSEKAQRFSKSLNIAVIPLFMVFMMGAAMQIFGALK